MKRTYQKIHLKVYKSYKNTNNFHIRYQANTFFSGKSTKQWIIPNIKPCVPDNRIGGKPV